MISNIGQPRLAGRSPYVANRAVQLLLTSYTQAYLIIFYGRSVEQSNNQGIIILLAKEVITMFFTITIYTYATLLVLGSLFPLYKAKKLSKYNSGTQVDEIIFETPKIVSQKVLNKIGSTVDVKGNENLPDGAALYVANHQGLFDILVLLGHLDKPVGFIAKKEIQRLPIINKWMELLPCVFMDRSDRRQSVKAIQKGIKSLQDGHSIVVFPEGTRSKTGKLSPFKSGSFRLATRAKVPIVPLAIDGTSLMLEANDGKVKRADVSLTIGKPVYPEEYESKTNGELANDLQTSIETMLIEHGKVITPEPIIYKDSVEQQ